MPKLTKRYVDNLDVRDADYIAFDTEICGFGIRVFPTGRKSYLIQYRNGGRTRRLALGKHGALTTEEARKEAAKRLGDVAKGEDPSALKRKHQQGPTVKALYEKFMVEHVQNHCKPNTARNYGLLFEKYILPKLGTFKTVGLKYVPHSLQLHGAALL